MEKALLAYASRNGETQKIAEIIAEGLRFSMIDVVIDEVKEFTRAEDLIGFDIYVFGSSTYHGEMLTPMKAFLFLAERGALKGKVGGSFGSYGWSGEAAERIYSTMKNIYGMKMVSSPLMLKATSVDSGVQVAQEYGKELGAKLAEQKE